ncbi:hypothetical protein TNCV_2256181 [Trichonephila clavipes]|nr:hypothetical protein TNCV_2256181 [Trichonephila clavipes]
MTFICEKLCAKLIWPCMTKEHSDFVKESLVCAATPTAKDAMNDTAFKAKSIIKCFKMSVEECGISVDAETHGHSSLNVVSIETLYINTGKF